MWRHLADSIKTARKQNKQKRSKKKKNAKKRRHSLQVDADGEETQSGQRQEFDSEVDVLPRFLRAQVERVNVHEVLVENERRWGHLLRRGEDVGRLRGRLVENAQLTDRFRGYFLKSTTNNTSCVDLAGGWWLKTILNTARFLWLRSYETTP